MQRYVLLFLLFLGGGGVGGGTGGGGEHPSCRAHGFLIFHLSF